jgi:ABC transport system ATP-binding/permease protein
VSRRHARFVQDEQGYRVEDLSSHNGVTVNGLRIEKLTPLRDGDRVGVGDYVIALRAENPAAVTTNAHGKQRPVPVAGYGATPPARLVMLSPPAPGAEFSITKPVVSIGRLEELDLCISHRSISREHAKVIQKDGALEIEDLRSANGVRVNGRSTKRGPLKSGDVVELGQVRFRFVGEGESYVFDPDEEQQLAVPPARLGPRRHTVAVLIFAAAIGGGLLAFLQDGNQQAGAAMRRETPIVPALVQPEPESHAEAEQALSACRTAIAEERFTDAVQIAEGATGLPGAGDELVTCMREGAEAVRIRAAYEQGMRALAENKLEDAYFLFAGIPDSHPYREHPEVKQTSEKVARERLARARRELRTSPVAARELASSVLEMHDLPASLRDEATKLLEGSTRPTPLSGPAEGAAARPRVAQAAPAARAEPEDPAKTARNCLARGDQRCAVRALEGKASNAQELALLIETYRALGETKKAVKHMETFVARFATARQTPQYRQFIAKHEQ